MKNRYCITVALALMTGPLAFAQNATTVSQTHVAQTATNAISVAVALDGQPVVSASTGGSGVDVEAILKQMEEAVRSALKNADAATRQAQEQAMKQLRDALKSVPGAAGLKSPPLPRVRPPASVGLHTWLDTAPDAPAVIVTRPMDRATRAEWEEDLRVMDKLLRDEVTKVAGGSPAEALGIRLHLTPQPLSQPMYLEDHGALFGYTVSFPLATAAKPTGKKSEAKPGSAWERARREIQSSFSTNAHGFVFSYKFSGTWPFGKPAAEFDASKVEALVEALIQTLAEAKNVRHLEEYEYVIVSVAGQDDAGTPVRLTLRAKKGDIDRFAAGKITLDEFRKKVARNVG